MRVHAMTITISMHAVVHSAYRTCHNASLIPRARESWWCSNYAIQMVMLPNAARFLAQVDPSSQGPPPPPRDLQDSGQSNYDYAGLHADTMQYHRSVSRLLGTVFLPASRSGRAWLPLHSFHAAIGGPGLRPS